MRTWEKLFCALAVLLTLLGVGDFHIFRAKLLAWRQGLRTVGVPAELPWRWLAVNYYTREAFALAKTLLLK